MVESSNIANRNTASIEIKYFQNYETALHSQEEGFQVSGHSINNFHFLPTFCKFNL